MSDSPRTSELPRSILRAEYLGLPAHSTPLSSNSRHRNVPRYSASRTGSTRSPPRSSIAARTSEDTISSRASHRLSGIDRPSRLVTDQDLPQTQVFNTPRRRDGRVRNTSGSSWGGALLAAEKDADSPTTTRPSATTSNMDDMSFSNAVTRLFSSPDASRSPSGRSRNQLAGTRSDMHGLPDLKPLSLHLYNQGFANGRHSDITIKAFDTSYRLHRLLLDRAPFFASALSGSWSESTAMSMDLAPHQIDENITQSAFELSLKRLYGCHQPDEEEQDPISLFATACWLEMTDLIASALSSIIRQMSTSNIGLLIRLVTSNYYGSNGDQILASAKSLLCRDGWEMPLKYWDLIPGEVIEEVLSSDGFFVLDEWHRFLLAGHLLNHRLRLVVAESDLFPEDFETLRIPENPRSHLILRFNSAYRQSSSLQMRAAKMYHRWLALYTNPNVVPLQNLIANGIYYMHMNFEQMQIIRQSKDCFGLPLLPDQVLNDALWMQTELRQRIVNAAEYDFELGLGQEILDDCRLPDIDLHNRTLPLSESGTEQDEDDTDQKYKNVKEDAEIDKLGITSLDSDFLGAKLEVSRYRIPNYDSISVLGGIGQSLYRSAVHKVHPAQASRLSISIDPVDIQWASEFRASSADRSSDEDRADQDKPVLQSRLPPFRFSVEFPSPRQLKEKKRVYSRTIWYAGSCWNVYMQKLEGVKSTQLGVYLHRAKAREPREVVYSSTTENENGSVGQAEYHTLTSIHDHESISPLREESKDHYFFMSDDTSSLHTLRGFGKEEGFTNKNEKPRIDHSAQFESLRPGVDNSLSGSEFGSSQSSCDARCRLPTNHRKMRVPAIPPYVDRRPTICTYFKIYSPSRAGKMLSVYESAPDVFDFSQSWGWKSSNMVLDDDICMAQERAEPGRNGDRTTNGSSNKDGGPLRFMITIGMFFMNAAQNTDCWINVSQQASFDPEVLTRQYLNGLHFLNDQDHPFS